MYSAGKTSISGGNDAHKADQLSPRELLLESNAWSNATSSLRYLSVDSTEQQPSLAQLLDANADGNLSPDEYRRARSQLGAESLPAEFSAFKGLARLSLESPNVAAGLGITNIVTPGLTASQQKAERDAAYQVAWMLIERARSEDYAEASMTLGQAGEIFARMGFLTEAKACQAQLITRARSSGHEEDAVFQQGIRALADGDMTEVKAQLAKLPEGYEGRELLIDAVEAHQRFRSMSVTFLSVRALVDVHAQSMHASEQSFWGILSGRDLSAHRQLLTSLLESWEARLKSGTFHSSREILEDIWEQEGFHGRAAIALLGGHTNILAGGERAGAILEGELSGAIGRRFVDHVGIEALLALEGKPDPVLLSGMLQRVCNNTKAEGSMEAAAVAQVFAQLPEYAEVASTLSEIAGGRSNMLAGMLDTENVMLMVGGAALAKLTTAAIMSRLAPAGVEGLTLASRVGVHAAEVGVESGAFTLYNKALSEVAANQQVEWSAHAIGTEWASLALCFGFARVAHVPLGALRRQMGSVSALTKAGAAPEMVAGHAMPALNAKGRAAYAAINNVVLTTAFYTGGKVGYALDLREAPPTFFQEWFNLLQFQMGERLGNHMTGGFIDRTAFKIKMRPVLESSQTIGEALAGGRGALAERIAHGIYLSHVRGAVGGQDIVKAGRALTGGRAESIDAVLSINGLLQSIDAKGASGLPLAFDGSHLFEVHGEVRDAYLSEIAAQKAAGGREALAIPAFAMANAGEGGSSASGTPPPSAREGSAATSKAAHERAPLAPADERVLHILLELVKDQDFLVRESAAKALGELGDPRAVDVLLELTRDQHKGVRESAAKALGELGDPSAVDALLELAKDQDREVRRSAALALGESGDPRAVDTLFKLAKHVEVFQDFNVSLAAFFALGQSETPRAVDALLELVKDQDRGNAAVIYLGRIGGPRVLDILLELTKDQNLRKSAVKSLGKLGDARAADALLKLAKDQDREVRISAVESLGELGDARAVDALLKMAQDQDPKMRKEVAESLGKLGDARAVDALLKLAQDQDPKMRKEVAGSLGRLGDARAVDALLELAQNKDVDVWKSAIEALGRIGDVRAVDALLVLAKDQSRDRMKSAIEALGKSGDPRAVDFLLELAQRNANSGRRVAIRALGKIGDPRAVDALLALAQDENGAVRFSAALALGELDDARAVDALLELAGDRDGGVRRSAAIALGKIDDPRAVDALLKLAQDEDRYVRGSMAVSLAESVRRSAPSTSSSAPPHPAGKTAALIRAVVARQGRDALQRARGFLNRGNHPGRRAESAGFDFREWREVQLGQSISGRLNYNRVAIRHDALTGLDEVTGGDLHEARFDQTQSLPSMLLIDPSILTGQDRGLTETAAGTIAQLNLQQNDPVGLMIGDGTGGNFMRPGTRAGTLEHSLKTIMDHHSSGKRLSPLALLEQGLLRKHLPTGSQVYLLSNFANESNLEGLERIIAHYRARGVTVVPVQIGEMKVAASRRFISIGSHGYEVNQDYLRAIAETRARWQASETAAFLERSGGIKVKGRTDAKVHEVAEGMLRDLRNGTSDTSFDVMVEIDQVAGSRTVPIVETSPPSDIFDRIDAIVAREDVDALHDLVSAAKVAGWSAVFEWVEGVIATLNHPFYQGKHDAANAPFELAGHYSHQLYGFHRILEAESPQDAAKRVEAFRRVDARRSMPSFRRDAVEGSYDDPRLKAVAGELAGPWDYEQWGYVLEALVGVVEAAHRMSDASSEDGKPVGANRGSVDHRAFREHASLLEPSIAISRNEELSANNSGVTSSPHGNGRGNIWMHLDQPLSGDHAYMALGIFARFDPAHGAYRELPGFTLRDFTRPEGGVVSGRLVSGITLQEIPTPLGGGVMANIGMEGDAHDGGRTVQFRLSSARVPDLITDAPLLKFREHGVGLYGDGYEVLTEAPPLEGMPADIQSFVRGLDGLTVGEAITAIRGFVVKHFEYRGYQGDARYLVFNRLRERAARGALSGPNEYLDFVLQSRAGKCAELSEVTVALMRMAGIPAAKCQCFVAEGQTVDAEAHALAVAVLPSNRGVWYAKPVETSVSFLAAGERARLEEAADAVASTDASSAEEATAAAMTAPTFGSGDHVTASAELFRGVEKVWAQRWDQASDAQRVEMSRMWGFYHHAMSLRGYTFMGIDAVELTLTPDQYGRFESTEVKSPMEWIQQIRELGVSREELMHYMRVWQRNQGL